MRKHRQIAMKKRGFTLMEVLLTIGIITIVVGGSLLANTMIMQSGEAHYYRNAAYQDANSVLEIMRRTAQTGAFPGNVTAAYPNGGTVAGFANIPGERVRVIYNGALTDDPLDVTVQVAWPCPAAGVCACNPPAVRCAILNTLITQRT